MDVLMVFIMDVTTTKNPDMIYQKFTYTLTVLYQNLQFNAQKAEKCIIGT